MTFSVGLDTSALDPEFKEHAQRGIGRYVSNLVRYFEGRPASAELRVQPFCHRSVRTSGPAVCRVANAMVDWLPAGRTTVRQQIIFPVQLRYASAAAPVADHGRHFDILHFPAHMDAPAWGLRGYILTVLDLIPLVCADLYRAQNLGPRFRFARWLELQAIKNARMILAISQNTAKDVERILGVNPDKIHVTPLGVNQEFFRDAEEIKQGIVWEDMTRAIFSRLGLLPFNPEKRQIILYVGGIDPRKNYAGCLKVFHAVVQYYREKGVEPPLLLMAGNISRDKEYPRLMQLISEYGLEREVHCLGYVSDTDLKRLFRVANLFLFLSLYEGFGLPPLEAMAAGVPVVSSNTSAMPEVLGTAALTVDPTDLSAATQAVLRVLGDNACSQQLRERGREQAALFTWQRTGELTEAAYRAASGLTC